MQNTNSEYGSPYLVVCHVTFIIYYYTYISVSKLVGFFFYQLISPMFFFFRYLFRLFLFIVADYRFYFCISVFIYFIYFMDKIYIILWMHIFLSFKKVVITVNLHICGCSKSKMTEKRNRPFPLPLWRTSCLLKTLKDCVQHAVGVSSARNRWSFIRALCFWYSDET